MLDVFEDGPARELLDSAPMFVYLKDAEGRHVFVNKPVADSLGTTPEAMAHTPCELWYPEHASRYYEDDLEVLRSGEPKRQILEPQRRQSGRFGWIETDKYPVWNSRGEATGILVLARDVTDREQFRQRRGTTAAAPESQSEGVAHDLNNLFTVIRGRVELLDQSLTDPQASRENLKSVLEAVDLAVGVTRRLLDPGRLSQQKIDVKHLFEATYRLLAPAMPGEIDFTIELPAGELITCCDPQAVSDALFNLVINAREAMPAGGRLVMSAERSIDNGQIVLCVRDSGAGIEFCDRGRVFDTHFSTKSDVGRGLGLAIARSLIRQQGGDLQFDSVVGRGSEFRILLGNVSDARPHDSAEQ